MSTRAAPEGAEPPAAATPGRARRSRDEFDRGQLTVVEDDGPTGGSHSRPVGSREVARFAREVCGDNDPWERLQRGVGLAVELIDGCDHAGVSVMTKGRLSPGPATDAVGWAADQLQQDLNEGPRLDAARTSGSVTSQDLAHELRWERWSPQVVEQLGVRAAMSMMLFDDTHVYGSLNLYADREDAWTGRAGVLAQVLATHLSLALGDALQIEHRGRAMESRTVIGQAQGILMERFNITADGAYAVLLRTSQQHNLKISVVSADLVRTARLPDSEYHVRTPPAPD